MLQTGRPGVVLVAYCVLVTGPHGPALCDRRLGTLLSNRLESRDLTLPRERHRYTASVSLLRRKL
jgi:hypothetical protein